MKENTRDRPQFGKAHIGKAIRDLRKKTHFRLREKGWGISVSRHEIYGLLAEEMQELLEAMTDHGPKAHERFREELLDIGVGAILGLCSIDTGEMDW